MSLSYEKMARNLQRIRAKLMPKPPKTAADVVMLYQDENVMKNFGVSLVRKKLNVAWRTI